MANTVKSILIGAFIAYIPAMATLVSHPTYKATHGSSVNAGEWRG